MSIRHLTAIALSIIACNNGTVEIVLDDPALQSDIVTVLPYDRDAIIADLGSMPTDAGLADVVLDSLPREVLAYRAVDDAWRRAHQALGSRLAELENTSRASAEYQALYAAHGRERAHVRELDRERSSVYVGLEARRGELDERLESIQSAWQDWTEDHADTYEQRTDRLERDRGGETIIAAITDSAIIRHTLTAGRWWVYLRVEDPLNPYGELYWNIPVMVPKGGTVRIALCEANADRRLRGAP